MSLDVVLTTPLTQALHSAILPKLVEVGWSTGVDDDAALAEYIILMLTSNKTQEEIASELSGDLLNLGPDDPGARDFAQWLSEQVGVLNAQLSGGDGYQGVQSGVAQDNSTTEAQDAEMGDASESTEPNVPTGPKSMRNGGMPGSRGNPRDKRMLGHLAKAMDRTNESVLHRVRPQVGNERINSHRAPPTGPRQQTQIRGAASRMQNGRGHGPMRTGNAVANILNMTPEQQMSMFALYEQQAQVLAQMFTPEQMAEAARVASMSAGNPSMNNNFAQNNRQGRSLFDRVQPSQRQNGFRNTQNNHHVESSAYNESPSSSMDVQMSQEKSEPSPDTPCRFNLSCTNKDCKFAHQSPAAPPGTTIDVSDVCSFGAACKNRKCVGRHPSPAQKTAHQTELDCKFYPNCTNSRCPFRHPSMPLCRNGADCTTPDCRFTHVKTLCKFNPCLNPTCTFKHVEGQKRGKFEDKIWVADGAKHVSERKFVDDEDKPEELIIPGGGGDGVSQASSATAELIA